MPRYVKTVTGFKAYPLHMKSLAFAGARILISLFLGVFTFSPTLTACSWSASNFCRACVIFWLSKLQVFKLLNHGKLYPGLVLTISLSCYPVEYHKEKEGA